MKDFTVFLNSPAKTASVTRLKKSHVKKTLNNPK